MKKVALGCVVLLVTAGFANAQLLSDDWESGISAAWSYDSAVWGANYAAPALVAGNPGQALQLGWGDGGGSGSQAVLQDFTVPAGVTEVAIDVDWLNVKGGGNGWYEIIILNPGGNWDGPAADELMVKEEYGFGTDSVVSEWHHANATKTVTPGETYTVALKVGGNPAGNNTASFDNLVITPEPASLLLLGLAGLPLMRRRRA